MNEQLSHDLVFNLETENCKPELQKPRMYRVIMLNDDYTPMDFVVTILKQFFGMPEAKAIQVMLQVHTQGKGICGVFTRDVAETKVQQVNTFSKMSDHPLLCNMEIV